jgi:Cof subfamily protein (haloacid dehalogenase superfamily)
MAAFRLVATDLDGTLLDAAGRLSPRTRAVVRTLHDAGIVLALATSRRLTGAAPVAAELGVSGPLILYDGAQVRDYPSGAIVSEDALGAGIAQDVCELLAHHGLRPIAQYGAPDGETLRVSSAPRERMPDATYLSHFASQVSQVPLAALCRGLPPPLRVVTFGSQRQLRLVARELAPLPCATQLLPTGNYDAAELTVFSPMASKGNALVRLAEQLGIPRAQTFAIGDGINDVSLLTAAGMSVAMGNASARVRAVAQHVAGSHTEDGAAEAIELYVLGNAGVSSVPLVLRSGLE